MKRNIMKLITSILLTLCLMVSLIGCGSTKDSKTNSNNSDKNSVTTDESKTPNTSTDTDTNTYGTGRFMESAYHPGSEDHDSATQGPMIYHILPGGASENPDNKFTVFCNNLAYSFEGDNKWSQQELTWFPQEENAFYRVDLIVMGDDGKEYGLFEKILMDSMEQPRYCIFQKTGETATKVEVPSLDKVINNEVDDNGAASQHEFCTFNVTKEGDFVLIFGDYAVYLEKNGKLHDAWTDIHGFCATSANDKLYALSADFENLNIYDLKSGELDSSISTSGLFSINAYYKAATMTKDANGTIYFQCDKGIYQLKKDTTTLTQAVDAALNTMSSGQERPCELTVDKDGNFENIRVNLDVTDWTVYQYAYNPDIATYPEEEMTIYSLYDSPEVRYTITRFQMQNPNIFVKYYVAIDSKDDYDLTVNDCVQALNTQLLAGEGPDIIYLDNFNINNFIEKGALTDITETVESNTALFDSVKNAFTKDGKIYAVPSRITIPVCSGNPDAVKATSSLQSLADYAKSSNKTLFGEVAKRTMINTLYRIYKNEMCDEDMTVNPSKVKVFLENLKTIEEHSTMMPDDQWCPDANTLYNIKDQKADLGFGYIYDNRSISEVLMLTDRSKTSLSTISGSFEPANIFSINKNTKKKDEALSFLKLILSDECQEKDYMYSGVAVNKNVVPSKLLTYNPMGRGGIFGEPFTGMDGISENLVITFPTDEQVAQYPPLYNDLTQASISNAAFDGKMLEMVFAFMNGDSTLDQTMTDISSFLSIYNAE